MTRELKFRAFNSKPNFVLEHFKPGHKFPKMVYFELTELDADLIVPSMTYITDETIIMQFTGLKDRNGTDIYDGDIFKRGKCKGEPILYVVKWQDENAGFGWKQVKPVMTMGFEINEVVVIGNIYEHPELLEDEPK